MPSGGHARSGPPRDPNALRRSGSAAANGWITLTVPTDPAPAWPPSDEPTDREAAIWTDLWSRPQATVWPRFNLTHEVAVYTRCLVEFESPGKTNAALGGLVRKLADDLGLTIVGAARNLWLLPDPQAPATVTPPIQLGRPGRPGGTSARDRFAVAAPKPPVDDDPAPF